MTTIYSHFVQSGEQITGGSNTLVCPGNDVGQCKGGDDPATPVTVQGKVRGINVVLDISFTGISGADTFTLTGLATGTTLGGSYTDSLGDAGSWTATPAMHPFGPPPGVYNYTGSLNSTANPLTIPPTLSLQLGGTGASASNLSGNGMVQSWPCVSSLSVTGQQFGDAFTMTDTTSKIAILVIPADSTGTNFLFNYRFDSGAPSCAGDTGLGTLALQPSPFDY